MVGTNTRKILHGFFCRGNGPIRKIMDFVENGDLASVEQTAEPGDQNECFSSEWDTHYFHLMRGRQ